MLAAHQNNVGLRPSYPDLSPPQSRISYFHKQGSVIPNYRDITLPGSVETWLLQLVGAQEECFAGSFPLRAKIMNKIFTRTTRS